MADFGLSEDVYSSGGYFCRSKEEVVAREEKVPIRWMAPESIETGKHSEKTDVVRPYIKDAHIIIVPLDPLIGLAGVTLCACVCVCTVGIWSYMLGSIHFWPCPILWDPCHEHSEYPQIWPETGETYQRHLL